VGGAHGQGHLAQGAFGFRPKARFHLSLCSVGVQSHQSVTRTRRACLLPQHQLPLAHSRSHLPQPVFLALVTEASAAAGEARLLTRLGHPYQPVVLRVCVCVCVCACVCVRACAVSLATITSSRTNALVCDPIPCRGSAAGARG
jgi:hypothetical protein